MESVEVTEMKEQQELDIRIKGWSKEEVIEVKFFSSGKTHNISFFCFFKG